MTPRRRQITYSERPNHAARAAHARGERQFKTYDTSQIRPKKSRAPMVFAAIIAVVVLIVAVFAVVSIVRGCTPAVEQVPEGQSVEVSFAEGSGAKTFGQTLADAGLIADSGEFVSRVNALDAASSLKPGTYTFVGGTSIDDIIAQLEAGPAAKGDTFVVPEGFTVSRMSSRIEEATNGRITADQFKKAASDASVYASEYPFLADAGKNSLEGFLFPKTYVITEDMDAAAVVRMMLSQYQKEVATLDYAYPSKASYLGNTGLTPYQALILASIVEKEATDETRGTVASVFYNRLAISMPLQSDATTAYVIGGDPSKSDIDNDTSAYSTYANNGLPPAPICSPGIESLKAVCAPEATEYLYFYFKADESGKMQYYFSKTNDEHNAAVFGS